MEFVMKEKPILFSTPMVKAILEGRKIMTRRVFKNVMKKYVGYRNQVAELLDDYSREPLLEKEFYEVYSPYFKDDILWVRETWCKQFDNTGSKIEYLADWYNKNTKTAETIDSHGRTIHYLNPCGFECPGWRPSIFLPREATRLFLKVENVRVERLQDISEADAQSEGVEKFPLFELKQIPQQLFIPGGKYGKGMIPQASYKAGFYKIWEELNDKREFGWDRNPWVWVIEFRRIEK
jgi:hypothetical protein